MRSVTYDVVVIGGGSAGIAAAIASANSGAKTLLVERHAAFGGQSTSSQVAAFCGFYTRGEKPDLAVGGVGAMLLEKMVKYGMDVNPYPSKFTGNTNIKFDPEIMKLIFDELMEESDATALLHTSLVEVEVMDDAIQSVVCCDDEGLFRVVAKQFVDASGNGNLVHAAGIPTQWGNEEGAVQQTSLVFQLTGLPNREISGQELEVAIKKGKAEGISHLFKEKGMIIKQATDTVGYCTVPSVFVNKLDGESLTNAEIALRRQVYAYAETFRRYVEGCENIRVAQSGPELGVREARRIIGDITLTGDEVLAATKRADSVGRASWSVEIHRGDTKVEYIYLPDNDYASIPLGILKVKGYKNIWAAGRIVSTDSIAFGSLRVMGTSLVTGQAAGVAAALFSLKGEVGVEEVQAELLKQDAFI